MRWDKEVENKLKDYSKKLKAVNNIKTRLEYLEKSLYTLKGSFRDTDPIQSGGCVQEDILLNKIMEKGELERNLSDINFELKQIDKVLKSLNATELEIIKRFFLDDIKIKVDTICNELGYEKSQIYNIKNQAIRKITLELYGKIEN